MRYEIKESIEFCEKFSYPIKRRGAVNDLWNKAYAYLTEERDGLAAAVCGRAEAQTLRLAMLYSIFDRSFYIMEEHLKAALAVWKYCEESAECIFGYTLGYPTADEITLFLRQTTKGMTRTEIKTRRN